MIQAGQSKIGDFNDAARLDDENVLRLQIAMHDAMRVEKVETAKQLTNHELRGAGTGTGAGAWKNKSIICRRGGGVTRAGINKSIIIEGQRSFVSESAKYSL